MEFTSAASSPSVPRFSRHLESGPRKICRFHPIGDEPSRHPGRSESRDKNFPFFTFGEQFLPEPFSLDVLSQAAENSPSWKQFHGSKFSSSPKQFHHQKGSTTKIVPPPIQFLHQKLSSLPRKSSYGSAHATAANDQQSFSFKISIANLTSQQNSFINHSIYIPYHT